jgi:signal transduction histidine kinase
MTPEQQAHVFEPFFTTKGIDKGMGIGLASTKNIVDKDFHGSISFRSAPGQGTVFIVRLPLTP